jgi:hypothetical protein
MSSSALIRKQDLLRVAEVAKATGCRIEIKLGDAVITIIPNEKPINNSGIDYSRPSL